jgi:hypothetical protein
MKEIFKRIIQLRPLTVTIAMTCIALASREHSPEGILDRAIRFGIAYMLAVWAMKPDESTKKDEKGN